MSFCIRQDIPSDTLHPRIPCRYNVFSNLHVYFNYNHINLSKTNDLKSSVSGKIIFQNHFIITFLAGMLFSAIYVHGKDTVTKIGSCISHTNFGKDQRIAHLSIDVCQRYSFQFTSSSHSLQVKKIQRVTWIGYSN